MTALPPVLVIGAGVIGLSTAVTFAEAGHSVLVRTAEPPDATTSAVAGALWGPWLVEPRARVLRWAEHTLTALRDLAAHPGTGVRLASGIEVSDLRHDPPAHPGRPPPPPQTYAGSVTDLRRLDLSDEDTTQQIWELQRLAYAVEAELIRYDGIPPLHESLGELRTCGESYLGVYDETGLTGAVSWTRPDDATLDICRLVVHPRAHRSGIATSLLNALDALEPAERTVVSTGTANLPALALYRNRGFVPTRQQQIAPGITTTELARHTPAAVISEAQTRLLARSEGMADIDTFVAEPERHGTTRPRPRRRA